MVELNLCTEHTGACCDKAQPGGVCESEVPESECKPSITAP